MTEDRLNDIMMVINDDITNPKYHWKREDVAGLEDIDLTNENYMNVVADCIEYAKEQEYQEEREHYQEELIGCKGWTDLIHTNLFHNAIGKLVYQCDEFLLVSHDY